MLSNHDDPALDVWERVDCTLKDFQALLKAPSVATLDTGNQRDMIAAGAMRESDSKVVSAEDAARANEARLNGNQLFGKGNFTEALQQYADAATLTEGRRDLLPNEQEVIDLRVSSFLNRSLCNLKLNKFADAAQDARNALFLDERNVKGLFRLATAECKSRDYDAAEGALAACEASGGDAAMVSGLRAEIDEGRRLLIREEKKKYSKMFA